MNNKREQKCIDKQDYGEMTNEEYRIELQKLFEGVDSNRLLRYFYIIVKDAVSEV